MKKSISNVGRKINRKPIATLHFRPNKETLEIYEYNDDDGKWKFRLIRIQKQMKPKYCDVGCGADLLPEGARLPSIPIDPTDTIVDIIDRSTKEDCSKDSSETPNKDKCTDKNDNKEEEDSIFRLTNDKYDYRIENDHDYFGDYNTDIDNLFNVKF